MMVSGKLKCLFTVSLCISKLAVRTIIFLFFLMFHSTCQKAFKQFYSFCEFIPSLNWLKGQKEKPLWKLAETLVVLEQKPQDVHTHSATKQRACI